MRAEPVSGAVLPLFQLINFNQACSRPATLARKNDSIVSGREGCEDRRLKVVWWCKTCCLNSRLLRIFPIIVGRDNSPHAVHQSHYGIDQSVCDAELRQSRSKTAYHHGSIAVTSAGNK